MLANIKLVPFHGGPVTRRGLFHLFAESRNAPDRVQRELIATLPVSTRPHQSGVPPPGDGVETSPARSHNQPRHSLSACARRSCPAAERSCPPNRRPARIVCCREDGATGLHTALPGNRHGQEDLVQTRAVKPFSDVASRRQNHPRFVFGHCRQGRRRCPTLLLPHASLQDEDVLGSTRKFGCEILELLCPAGQKQRATSRFYGAHHVASDHLVA